MRATARRCSLLAPGLAALYSLRSWTHSRRQGRAQMRLRAGIGALLAATVAFVVVARRHLLGRGLQTTPQRGTVAISFQFFPGELKVNSDVDERAWAE